MAFLKVTRTRLVDKVVESIYNQISNGTLRAGDKLPGEVALGEQLGVARPTVREAIGQLIGLGLIVRGEYGVLVAQVPTSAVAAKLAPMLLANWETRQLYEARMAIESEIAVLACARAARKDIDELTRLNLLMLEQCDDDHSYWELDMAFHRLVAKMCGNDILISMHDIIDDLFRKYEKSIITLEEIKKRTHAWHAGLIEAFRKKDGAQARNIVKTSLQASEEALIALQMKEKT
jgi:GntR family transcriptional regulator, transcriptional repressor for pyruvate dehydrogenase complex